MSGFVIVVLAVIAFYAAFFTYQKMRANQILSPQYVEVSLPVDTVLMVGTKASGSLLHRLARSGGRLEDATNRPVVERTDEGAYEWRVRSKAGVLAFQAVELAGNVRVTSAAEELEIAQYGTNLTGLMGVGFAIANSFYRATNMPRDPVSLNRCRKRVFRALLNAAG
jgi:hypothetical protein